VLYCLKRGMHRGSKKLAALRLSLLLRGIIGLE
jgi:hypothetical protein